MECVARMCLLLSVLLFASLFPGSCAHAQANMKASFNLKHDADTATVSIRPSVSAEKSATLDYRLEIAKQGAAGTSRQINGGRIDVVAGRDAGVGPVMRFGSFSAQDSIHLELRLCREGSRCKHPEDLIARFTSSYPDDDGERP